MTTTPARARRPRRASVAQGHLEWLKLIDVAGPFLSLKVLAEAFPQGLDRPADDVAVAEDLRLAFDGWDGAQSDPAVHTAFVRFVIERLLEYPPEQLHSDPGTLSRWSADLREHGARLVPTHVVGDPERPALLVMVVPAAASLERAATGDRLIASPAERMRLLLRDRDVRSGVVTNGERWMLVHVPPEGTATFATWGAALMIEERPILRAFRSLLGARRTIGQPADDSLDGLLARSADDEREVTDALGDQARRVVELLVGAIDAADRERHGELLAGVEPPTLYEAAVAVAMRLIFLLTAEAQGMLPGDGVWAESYALAPLRPALIEDRRRDGEDVLARRFDAWPRLLASFRAIHGGVEHGAARLPGYGGGLFDPARYPFLEGDGAGPPRVSNAHVLRALGDLQTLEVRVPGGRERRPLSFEALGVEQIGHVYERLLEHWAVRATDPALGLGGKKEPEIPLAELEAAAARGERELIDLLVERTGRAERAVMKDLVRAPDAIGLDRLRAACDNDEDLLDRVIPYAGLIRDDGEGRPCVFLAGRIYVTERPGGRAFQSHYTPRSLTEPTVKYALEPLVFEGPAEGWERERWRLREPGELLALRICDIAVGSAAFLVEACRQLARHLVASWALHPGGRESQHPSDPDEQDLLARRLIAERCLYGVDKNPLAIEIAKVSLWLVTLRRDRPFTFLDHALRVGDSLVGITEVAQLEYLSLSDRATLLPDDARAGVTAAVRRARGLRAAIMASDAMDLRQVGEKHALLADVERTTAALRATADVVVGAALASQKGSGKMAGDLVAAHADQIRRALAERGLPDVALENAGRTLLLAGRVAGADDLRPLHWPLEFPEVFEGDRSGFDMIVGNPPFLGGRDISTISGTPYREHLVRHVAAGATGAADLCAYFFLRAGSLIADRGTYSMLATNTIAQGDTREVGLGQITSGSAAIMRAIRSRKWPSEANLEIAQVWLRKDGWHGRTFLDDDEVPAISSHLGVPRRTAGDPYRLMLSAGRAFQGIIVLGLGFVVSADEARGLIEQDPRNAEVLFPYLTGEDLQSRPDQSPSRWVIDFGERTEAEARAYAEPFAIIESFVRPERVTKDSKKYPRMVHEWWKFWNARPAMRAALQEHPLAFARSRVSNNHCLVAIVPGLVPSEATVVFVADEWGEFSVIQSGLHEAWIWRQASSMRTDVRYTPSDCFETFPFPPTLPPGDTGQELHDFRAERTRARNEGLTPLTNRINDPAQDNDDIVHLRELMVRLDQEVAAAYGWDDLDLDHGFHPTRIGRRFTIAPPAREEIVDRLLELNHARYAEEVAQGLHAKKKGKARRKAAPAQASLLGDELAVSDP